MRLLQHATDDKKFDCSSFIAYSASFDHQLAQRIVAIFHRKVFLVSSANIDSSWVLGYRLLFFLFFEQLFG